MYQKIHKYLDKVTPQRPPVLREMEIYAEENNYPIIGPLVGRYLYQSAQLMKARRILELGSGFGYSAFWFSLAMKSKGHIVMTDTDNNNKRMAFDYFKRAGLQSQFDYKVGDALKIANKIDGSFDIILNDIDKIDYLKTIDIAANRLKRGGLFITDNIIWSGRVCDKKPDQTTEALYQDSRFYVTLLPLRDGLAVALKL